ncbi:MAG TPA: prolipoprotein diacylglyceryl transferase [Candidatus Cloacimonadota bacterium]|mgnify:FL=1|jgi:phosphatidylglycerol:prolipoprotein diacylglycerol transferase|nr:prolipoprotein diacylglyceryl transferase [Candidatus Cloacimonadota bacterium]HOR57932.1 prolipoprotein diacylglyceryl transferase [Candidatus Cloacimonadota bacterium]HPB08367.1 prolipoprotein diacylglyceryl transferase [Candidatus Cloacimonadota bacterium]HPL23009.1 prolipoprotein diacylglyceryl transferase [Candidatus Cloacimonadota bacterium]HQP17438.1 prolipoprotein diacylglyceryl transferase [Candidatus Cloacimonadota bacterium]
MLKYPQISPDIVQFNLFGLDLHIRWYGFFYVLSFIIGYIFYRRMLKIRGLHLSKEHYEGLIFAIMLGVVLGGRLGYILFYNLPYYLRYPLEIFSVWEGGMSFHGGALGVIIAGWVYLRKHKLSFYPLADAAMPLVAIGLGLGRLGNFINGELWGNVTTVPWGMVFPGAGDLPRHPTQLYEFFLEGVVLFIVTYLILRRCKKDGMGFWSFIGLYGVFRFLIEFVREPDDLDVYRKYGYFLGFMTIGQILSLLMIIAAAIGIWSLYRQKPESNE